jgi:hypothetical protein
MAYVGIIGIAVHAPIRKWLRTIGSVPVKVTGPPPSEAATPIFHEPAECLVDVAGGAVDCAAGVSGPA